MSKRISNRSFLNLEYVGINGAKGTRSEETQAIILADRRNLAERKIVMRRILGPKA